MEERRYFLRVHRHTQPLHVLYGFKNTRVGYRCVPDCNTPDCNTPSAPKLHVHSTLRYLTITAFEMLTFAPYVRVCVCDQAAHSGKGLGEGAAYTPVVYQEKASVEADIR